MVEQAAEREGVMTVEEFVRRYEQDGPFELIEGEIRQMSPTVAGHNDASKKLYDSLIAHDPGGKHGAVYFEAPFILEDVQNWVKGSRVPDVMYFRAERLAAYKVAHPDWREKPYILIPDLVAEVISQTDTYTEVDTKVDRYLDDGVTLVWVVDPAQKSVTVRRRDVFHKLHADDTLSGDEVVPGFTVMVGALFG